MSIDEHVRFPILLRDWHSGCARFDEAKRQNAIVSKLYGIAGFPKYASRIAACGDCVLIAWRSNPENPTEQFPFVANGRFCRCRWCPLCQVQRCRKNLARLKPTLEALVAQDSLRILFLTLTIKNVPVTSLRSTLKGLSKAYSAFLRLSEVNRSVRGSIRALEWTRGADGTAHPHIHSFLLVKASYFNGKNYLSQKRMTELWAKAARLSYRPVVNIQAIPKNDDGLRELLKYPMKVQDLTHSPEWLGEVTRQAHHIRLLAPTGIVRQKVKTLDDGYNEQRKEQKSAKAFTDAFIFDFDQLSSRYKLSAVASSFP